MRLVARVTVLLTFGTIIDAKTTQPTSMDCAEGRAANLPCNHSTIGGNEYVYWYRQIHSQGPQYVIHGLKNKETNAMASLIITEDRKSSTLILPHATLRDTAVYYCIVRAYSGAGSYQLTFGKGTKLSVIPNIQNPDPAVYQLKGSKSNDTSVCLFTDFDSVMNVSQSKDSDVHITDKTVLDMRSMDFKSNGAVAWSNKSDFACTSAFKDSVIPADTFFPGTESVCDANLVEKSFETDMNLNFQNLSVIGFRILLLKVAGFNLLMTLRLWSS